MVVLVTGAGGQLGQALQYIAQKHSGITFHFYGSSQLDIRSQESIHTIFEAIKPNFCVNAAAYTAVDKSENDRENAYAINVKGVQHLAEACRDFGTTLIHISTDFVFDGKKQTPYTESDPTNPQGVYGRTKLEGEDKVREVLKSYFIIRTSWVYSQFGNNFMKTMLRLAGERDSLSVVNDQIGTPTHAIDLAEAIVTIVLSNSRNYGVYNFSNEGTASWYDFARKIFEVNNVTIDLKPIPTSQFPTPAKRPEYSVLDKSKFKSEFKKPIASWEVSLQQHQV